MASQQQQLDIITNIAHQANVLLSEIKSKNVSTSSGSPRLLQPQSIDLTTASSPFTTAAVGVSSTGAPSMTFHHGELSVSSEMKNLFPSLSSNKKGKKRARRIVNNMRLNDGNIIKR